MNSRYISWIQATSETRETIQQKHQIFPWVKTDLVVTIEGKMSKTSLKIST